MEVHAHSPKGKTIHGFSCPGSYEGYSNSRSDRPDLINKKKYHLK
jgi:hypothetical protein